MFRRARSRLSALFHGDRFHRELDEEMAFHMDRLAEDLIREGLDPEEARREARLRFGSAERAQSRSREARGLAFFDETGRNVRFAIRSMTRSPVFAGTFILTLALCIGLGTAVVTVVDSVLWRPLPYPSPDRLANAILYDPSFGKTPGGTSVDGHTWERIRDEGDPLQRAVYSGWISGVNLSTESASAFVKQQRVGAGYFRTLGVLPQLGRGFEAAEDVPDGPAVAVLSHGLWTGTFGGDPEMIGRAIRLKGETHTVVGVMPREFRSEADADVWTPLRASRSGEGGGTNFTVLIRVPEGMSVQEAEARLASVHPPRSTLEDAPELRFGLVPLNEALTAELRLPLLILLGAIGLMLVVGCANLASLQIARALARRTEMATRQALGSGTGALVRQLVAENLLLGLFGGLAGLFVAFFAMDGLEALVRSHFDTWQDVALDGRALAAALGLTVLATGLFGLAPVLRVRNPGIQRALVTGSRGMVGGGGHTLRKALLVGEVAMVTTLLFAAGLLVRSYGHLEGLDPGFDPEGVLTVQFSLDDARYATNAEVGRLFQETVRGIRRIPGVASAAVTLTLPYERPLNLPFRLPGDDPRTTRVTNAVYVTPGFFEAMGIPRLQGRSIEDGDRDGAPIVAVANQAFVEEHLPDRPPLGTPVEIGFGGGEGVEIVGVVGNVQQNASWGGTAQPVWETPTLYLPAAQAGSGFFRMIHVWFSPSWIIRGSAPEAELAAQVTEVFREVDPDLPVARFATLRAVMRGAFARQRFEAAFLTVVAAFALLLATIGLYGIVAHEVLERRSEMGLRMALGATPLSAIWSAGTRGIVLSSLGLTLGTVLALGVARVMEHMIWGVTPWDPLALAGLLGILALFTLLASFVPAARVGRMDPATILREG
ncbi:MAG: ADOP family duplicated permease [Longimicrobiales bacterium]